MTNYAWNKDFKCPNNSNHNSKASNWLVVKVPYILITYETLEQYLGFYPQPCPTKNEGSIWKMFEVDNVLHDY